MALNASKPPPKNVVLEKPLRELENRNNAGQKQLRGSKELKINQVRIFEGALLLQKYSSFSRYSIFNSK